MDGLLFAMRCNAIQRPREEGEEEEKKESSSDSNSISGQQ